MVHSYSTTSAAYVTELQRLLQLGVPVAPRGQPCRELIHRQFMITRPDSKPIETCDKERNEVIQRYQAAEMALYLAGERRASVWAERASKFWASIANDDGTINSNYGWLALMYGSANGKTQFDWAAESLKRDRESRQAFIRFSLPEHQRFDIKDQVCTMHMNFMIRNGQMHGCAVMRSNDIVRGLVYDMPWFCYLLEAMALELNVPVGTYTHFAHSFHLYERDIPVARRMCYDKPRVA